MNLPYHLLRPTAVLAAVTLAAGSLALSACESEFTPFEETDAAFSLFGYFDAAADTQFVRVSALRRTAFDEAPVDAVVTLTNVGTGAVVVLRDSLFRYLNGAVAHNFWTTARVAPGTAYRLSAAGATGTATAEFTTPAAFPDPSIEAGVSFNSSPSNPPLGQSMFFRGIEKFADLRVTYVLADANVTVTVSYLDRVQATADGGYVLGFNAYADVQQALAGTSGQRSGVCPSLRTAHVFVASATPAWPDLLGLDPEVLLLPATFSNVKGGLGYVGGVVTRRYRWEELAGAFAINKAGCQ